MPSKRIGCDVRWVDAGRARTSGGPEYLGASTGGRCGARFVISSEDPATSPLVLWRRSEAAPVDGTGRSLDGGYIPRPIGRRAVTSGGTAWWRPCALILGCSCCTMDLARTCLTRAGVRCAGSVHVWCRWVGQVIPVGSDWHAGSPGRGWGALDCGRKPATDRRGTADHGRVGSPHGPGRRRRDCAGF